MFKWRTTRQWGIKLPKVTGCYGKSFRKRFESVYSFPYGTLNSYLVLFDTDWNVFQVFTPILGRCVVFCILYGTKLVLHEHRTRNIPSFESGLWLKVLSSQTMAEGGGGSPHFSARRGQFLISLDPLF